MKKLNKRDFKKLALMGIAGGTALATTQGNANELTDIMDNGNATSEMLAFAGCGNHGGCGGYQAYRTNSNYYYSQQPNGCQTMSDGQWGQQGCQAQSGQWDQSGSPQQQYFTPNYQAQPPMQNTQQMQNMQQPYYQQNMQQPMQQPMQNMQQPMQNMQQPMTQPAPQVSYGCGAQSRMSGQGQRIAGCNSPAPNLGNMPNQPNGNGQPMPTPNDAVKKGQAYTQWETADNSQPSYMRRGNNWQDQSSQNSNSNSQGSMTQTKMSESDLMSQLNSQGKAAYQALDPAGKALALKMANQTCKNQNDCKGLNSCKTEEHACAGKGSCAGTAPAPFKDKNLAVKVAAMKMAEKRANAAPSKF